MPAGRANDGKAWYARSGREMVMRVHRRSWMGVSVGVAAMAAWAMFACGGDDAAAPAGADGGDEGSDQDTGTTSSPDTGTGADTSAPSDTGPRPDTGTAGDT